MSGRGIMFTTLLWHDSRGGEVETRARVVYSHHNGFRGSHIDPPEPASIEIQSITSEPAGIEIPDQFFEDEELLAECMQDWVEDEAEAKEWLAQSRRDDRLMERFERSGSGL